MIHAFTQSLDTANTEDGGVGKCRGVGKRRGVYGYAHEVIQHTLMQLYGWIQGGQSICVVRELK